MPAQSGAAQYGPDATKLAYVSALTYDMILTQPVIDDFERITAPTTLIIGTRDRTGPNRANKRAGVARELGRYDRLGDEAAAKIPNAHLTRLEGVGHLLRCLTTDFWTTGLKRRQHAQLCSGGKAATKKLSLCLAWLGERCIALTAIQRALPPLSSSTVPRLFPTH